MAVCCREWVGIKFNEIVFALRVCCMNMTDYTKLDNYKFMCTYYCVCVCVWVKQKIDKFWE